MDGASEQDSGCHFRLLRGRQFLLKCFSKEDMALLAEEDKKLCPSDPLDNRLLCWGAVNWWRPERWTHVSLPHVLKMPRSQPYVPPAVNHYLYRKGKDEPRFFRPGRNGPRLPLHGSTESATI